MRQLKITQQITKRDSVSVDKYLAEISAIPLLTMEEEVELPRLILLGDKKAFDRFVSGNLRFVISVAKQYQQRGALLGDLINAGNEGLIKAANRYDPSRGFKFISYAVWWIRQSIMSYLNDNGKGIRLPLNKLGLINKIKNITSKLEQDFERNPTSEEISEELFLQKGQSITADEIDEIIRVSNPISSLDTPIGTDESLTLIDMIRGETMMDINSSLKHVDLQFVIKKIFEKKLTPKEQQVVTSYFGLFGATPKSLDELGFEHELTRERVRQIKEKAIRKMKFHSTSKELKGYM
jgi:RNA polymerase primary sigma factor